MRTLVAPRGEGAHCVVQQRYHVHVDGPADPINHAFVSVVCVSVAGVGGGERAHTRAHLLRSSVDSMPTMSDPTPVVFWNPWGAVPPAPLSSELLRSRVHEKFKRTTRGRP